jgi:hypothetical protein
LLDCKNQIVDSGIRGFEEILRSSTPVYVRRKIMAPELHPSSYKEDFEDT